MTGSHVRRLRGFLKNISRPSGRWPGRGDCFGPFILDLAMVLGTEADGADGADRLATGGGAADGSLAVACPGGRPAVARPAMMLNCRYDRCVVLWPDLEGCQWKEVVEGYSSPFLVAGALNIGRSGYPYLTVRGAKTQRALRGIATSEFTMTSGYYSASGSTARTGHSASASTVRSPCSQRP